VALVLTLVTNKNKYTQTKQYKNTVNTRTYITKTPTHTTKQVKTTVHESLFDQLKCTTNRNINIPLLTCQHVT